MYLSDLALYLLDVLKLVVMKTTKCRSNKMYLHLFKISIDEGFIDETPSASSAKLLHNSFLHDDLQIWTDCLSSDWQTYRTWERLTRCDIAMMTMIIIRT